MKIMTNIKTLAALLMAGAAFAACSSSDENIIETQQPANPTGKYTMTVKASKGDAAATRALGISGNTLNATWADGEKVKVYEGENLLGELSATNSNGTECTLTGDLTALPSASGVTLTLKFNAATLGGQNGTLNYIASHNDYATATTVVSAIDGNTITGSDASFTNQNAIAKITVKNNNSVLANPSQITVSVTTTNVGVLALLAQLGKSLPSYTFDVTDAYTTNGGDFLYFALPTLSVIATEMGLNETQAATIAAAAGEINLDLTATVGSDTYTYTKTGYPFTQSKYYVITVNMTKQAAAPTGALTGQFTISNDGGTTTRQVVFSQGNLQAVFAEAGSTCTWKFADNQYDYVGNNAANTSINGNGSVSAAGTVDLFGWVGASSSFEGAAMYGVSNSSSGYGNTNDNNLRSDWGNTMGDGWFTLKKDEWTYLITGRTDANQKYGFGNVGGVNGMILLPDSWTLPDGLSFTSGSGGGAWQNSYTTEQWSQMEDAGAVFLPAVGYRSGSSVGNTGSVGEYWTSTPRTGHWYFSAYYQKFDSNSHSQVGGECSTGCSVRLVRLAE